MGEKDLGSSSAVRLLLTIPPLPLLPPVYTKKGWFPYLKDDPRYNTRQVCKLYTSLSFPFTLNSSNSIQCIPLTSLPCSPSSPSPSPSLSPCSPPQPPSLPTIQPLPQGLTKSNPPQWFSSRRGITSPNNATSPSMARTKVTSISRAQARRIITIPSRRSIMGGLGCNSISHRIQMLRFMWRQIWIRRWKSGWGWCKWLLSLRSFSSSSFPCDKESSRHVLML